MTPKEKAEELFDRYHYIEMDLDENLFCDSCDYNRKLSKYCAIIAVDETIEEVREFCDDNFINDRLHYWEEVKEELIKL